MAHSKLSLMIDETTFSIAGINGLSGLMPVSLNRLSHHCLRIFLITGTIFWPDVVRFKMIDLPTPAVLVR
ncbi:hypothetical protein JCM14108_1221 [Lentilactobacillus farraginis DSM 18382 = JCM 14108]|uniref:Uncharacterized protein n=1 Tax=Lentilactobacillus farraginis DSM 18382 = JCM 14108 TaxID=1423743 RepID=X0QCC1_9LACO|nr:hypothetical protein JCM14108_1221 [Lentilactobacillus farraginis DSM 18382 = JCM 14108]